MNPLEKRLLAVAVSAAAILDACGGANEGVSSSITTAPTPSIQTSIPSPTTKVEIVVPPTPENGWTRFHSLNFPYQIDYPSEWNAQSTQIAGKKVDLFRGEIIDGFQVNVNVLSEPVNSWVTVDDYAQNYVSQLLPGAVYGKESIELVDKNKYKNADQSKLSDVQKAIVKLYTMDVAGIPTRVVSAYTKSPLGFGNQISLTTALLIKDGQGYQITYSSSTNLGNEKAGFPSLIKFQQMLERFTFNH